MTPKRREGRNATGAGLATRIPYHTTGSGLFRKKTTHPITGERLTLSSHSLGDLMDRWSKLEALRRDYELRCACPFCGKELAAPGVREQIAEAFRVERDRNVAGGGKARVTLEAAWEAYAASAPREQRKKLRSTYKHMVAGFFPAGHTLAATSEARVCNWFLALEKEGYAPATIRNAFFMLVGSYIRAARGGKVPRAFPWGDVKPPRIVRTKERRRLEPHEILAIARELGGTGAQAGRIFLFAALTGLRNGELAGLGWDDIRGDVMHVRHQALDEWKRLYPGKTRPDFEVKGKRRHFQKLHPQALDMIERQRRALQASGGYSPDGPVWPAHDGGWKRNATAIRAEKLQRAARRAGLPSAGVFAHALRHGFVTWEFEGGADLLTTQARVGHASVQTTASYPNPAHLPPSKIPPLDLSALDAPAELAAGPP